MSPVKFDYVPGRIEARFSHDIHDYIHLDVHLTRDDTVITPCDQDGNATGESEHRYGISDRFTVYMSSPFCAFGDFIAFLEAIAVGVQRCSFRWEAEGPEGRMSWSRSASGMGTLGIQWYSRGDDIDHGILVDRYQAVEALYGALRSFVDSSEYDPFRYEALSLGDAIEVTLQDGTLADVAHLLAGLDALQVEDRLQRLLANLHSRTDTWRLQKWPGFQGEWKFELLRLVPPAWDGWPMAERMARLSGLLDYRAGSWFGANLRKLRSPIVESMLANRSPRSEVAASLEVGKGHDVLH